MRHSLGTTRAAVAIFAAALVTLAGGRISASGQAPPGQTPLPAPAASKDYVFSSGAGMLFFYVKPDKSAEFEAVVKRLSEALDKTADPDPQAAGRQLAHPEVSRAADRQPRLCLRVRSGRARHRLRPRQSAERRRAFGSAGPLRPAARRDDPRRTHGSGEIAIEKRLARRNGENGGHGAVGYSVQ